MILHDTFLVLVLDKTEINKKYLAKKPFSEQKGGGSFQRGFRTMTPGSRDQKQCELIKIKRFYLKKSWQNFLIIKGAPQNMTVARRLLSSLNFEFVCCVQSSTDFYMSDFWQNYPKIVEILRKFFISLVIIESTKKADHVLKIPSLGVFLWLLILELDF